MSADQIILLAVWLIVIAAVAVTVAYATAFAARGTPRRSPGEWGLSGPRGNAPDASEPAFGAPAPRGGSFFTPASTRQIARVVALLFLAAVAVVVAVTRAWTENESAIFTLLAAGVLLVVLSMDMLPPSALGRWRRPLEGIGATIFLGLLMALTGGAGSPFLVGFYLVAAGTALSVEGRAPIAVALVGAATIAVVGLADAIIDEPLDPEALAWVGINAVSLILLADIATAAARAQRHARDEALRASRFDALTGLYNRAFFFTTMEQELRRSDRMGRGFTMLMLDLDDLKPVNDTFGHQWGDRLLKAIADTIRRTVRFTDAAARYGGDEFVVLLPETDAAGGFVVAEKLRRDIASVTLRAADRNVRSSVSIGLVAYPDDGSTAEQLVAAADVAMYEAKRRGKNRIVGYQERTERVATDIDADTHVMVSLGAADDVRTGGDPAPWADVSSSAAAEREWSGTRPAGQGLLEPPARGRADRSSIPVRPDATPAPPWWTEAAAPPERQSPQEAEPGQDQVQEPEGGRDRPSDSGRGSPPDDVPPRPQGSSTGGIATAAPPSEHGGTADQPWLTRTDAAGPTRAPMSPGQADTTRDPGAGGSRQRPAADLRSGGAARRGGGSRSDEIRGGERPWIALPIEPDDGSPRAGR